MADIDWGRAAIEAAASAASGLVGLVIGAWRWGRNSAKAEQELKDDYNLKINTLRDDVRVNMEEYEKSANARNDLLIAQIRETLEGIRRQMDELRYHTENRFLAKEDFNVFRKEYREDTKLINEKLDKIISR